MRVEKIFIWLKEYGAIYTIKKLLEKIYTRYLLGAMKVNRRLSKAERKRQETHVFQEKPVISIVVPLYNTPEKYLREMIESVREQTYANWQLCMADGSDKEHRAVQEICQMYAGNDTRICYEKLKDNQGISENTNACLAMAEGEYVGLFDHDDLLHPSVLYEVVKCIEDEQADFIYTDEATFLGRETKLLSVHRKPDFYMDNLRANNYICHFTVFRKSLLEEVGYFRKEFDGSQDHDLILRLCERATKICHIPKVLYFWRAHAGSVALRTEAKEYVVEAGRKAVEAHLKRCHVPGTVEVVTDGMSIYDVKYQYDAIDRSNVAILKESQSMDFDEIMDTIKECEYVLVMSKEVNHIEKASVERLLLHMARPEVAAVVPRLVDKKGKILSAGVEVKKCGNDWHIHHLFQGIPRNDSGYMNRLLYVAGTQVVYPGCVMVRSNVIREMLEQKKDIYNVYHWFEWSLKVTTKDKVLVVEPRAEAT